MKDFEKKIRFIELRAWGESYSTIAEQLGVSKQTLCKWAKLASTQARIAELEVLEADALRDAYQISFRARIDLLCQTLKAANEEMARRNAEKHAKMSTAALLKLITTCSEQIQVATTFPIVDESEDFADEDQFDETEETEQLEESMEQEGDQEADDVNEDDFSDINDDAENKRLTLTVPSENDTSQPFKSVAEANQFVAERRAFRKELQKQCPF